MNKFERLKAEYNRFSETLGEMLPNADYGEELLQYYMAAALKIWGSNVLYSPDYTRLLNTISEKDYTIEQVISALGCSGEPQRELLVPSFIKTIMEKDAELKTGAAYHLLERLNDLLVSTAVINGDFTLEEANALSSIMQDLTKYAARVGAPIKGVPKAKEDITEQKKDSYLQNDALLKEVEKHSKTGNPPKECSSDEKDDGNVIPIEIVLEMCTDENGFLKVGPAEDDKPVEVQKPKQENEETIESLLEDLDELVGMRNIKQDVHSLMNFIKVTKLREKRGMRVPKISYHLVFTGNPGTGKTTIARLVARLYYHMGILPQGQLVETDRSSLVAGYMGQTAIKTQKVIQQAMGGVLFIDEAYSLNSGHEDSYGKEAIETILKAMEDHRDELVVIVAGYPELMRQFITSNPGLSSRFSKYFDFEDYSGEELLAIFECFCEKNGYRLTDEAAKVLLRRFDKLYAARNEHFGNARTARNIFEKAINVQADRIAGKEYITDTDLIELTKEDILKATGDADDA